MLVCEVAALFFITRVSSLTDIVDDGPDTIAGDRVRSYELFGSLFFGSANRIEPLLERADPSDPARVIVLDMQKALNVDTTGLDILETLRRKMKKNGKTLIITGAGPQPLSLFKRSRDLPTKSARITCCRIAPAALRVRVKSPGGE